MPGTIQQALGRLARLMGYNERSVLLSARAGQRRAAAARRGRGAAGADAEGGEGRTKRRAALRRLTLAMKRGDHGAVVRAAGRAVPEPILDSADDAGRAGDGRLPDRRNERRSGAGAARLRAWC